MNEQMGVCEDIAGRDFCERINRQAQTVADTYMLFRGYDLESNGRPVTSPTFTLDTRTSVPVLMLFALANRTSKS